MGGGRVRNARVACCLALLLAPLPRPAAAQSAPVNVLLLSSIDLASPESVEFIAAMKSEFRSAGRRVEVFAESLDLLRLPPIGRYDERFQALLAARYGGMRIDAILAQSSQAAEAALRFRDARFPGVPLYCFDMLDPVLAERLSTVPDLYGRPSQASLGANLRLASRLFPKARTAYILVTIGNPQYVPGFYEDIDAARAALPGLELRAYVNTSLAEVEAALAAADEASFAFISPGAWKLPSGETIAGTELVDRLAAKRPIPYFGGFPSLMGTALVGGSFVDRGRMGREAGAMVLSILSSESKPPAWAYANPYSPILDYRAVKRFSIPPSRLPPEARLLNEPPAFWVAYELPLKLLGAALVLALLVLTARFLSRRREALILRESNERLELTVSRRTGELREANAELEASNQNLRLSLRRIEGMQDRLVAETRETVLGRIALSLAHEINNPLAVIGASLHSLRRLVGGGDLDVMALVAGLDDEGRSLFHRVLAETRGSSAPGEDEDSYGRRLALEARLKALGLGPAGGAAELADSLVDAGLDGLGDEDLALLCRPERGRLLEALYRARLIEGGIARSGRAAERIRRKVEAMRSYARDCGGSGEGASASAADSIERSLALFREVDQGEVRVRKRIDAGLPAVAAADASLVRVWGNLFQNAIQAMDGRGELEVAARLEAPFVAVEILDSGPGLPPGLREHLFSPFDAAKDIDKGMGLGLPICKRIVEGCGGTISLGEREGRTMFTVRLPVLEVRHGD